MYEARLVNALPSLLIVGRVHVKVALPVVTGAAITATVKGAREVVTLPSLTLMVIPVDEPTLAAVGTPLNLPLAVLKVAHAGLLLILKPSASPLASLAVGVKL